MFSLCSLLAYDRVKTLKEVNTSEMKGSWPKVGVIGTALTNETGMGGP